MVNIHPASRPLPLTTRRIKRRVCFLLLIFFSSNSFAQADDSDRVREVLSKMSSAMRELDYQGLFTFEFGSALDTYKIVHKVEQGRELERLQRLNGSPKEFHRQGREISCLSRGDQLLRGMMRSFDHSDDLLDSYRFNLLAEERIAGRAAMMLEILPRDEYRYGYYLGIDKASGLPLKALLLGPKQTVLERLQFVELSVGPNAIDAAALKPDAGRYQEIDPDPSLCEGSSPEAPTWQAQWLPKGFEFSGQRRTRDGSHMLSYTDGLATFSIFIDDSPGTEFSGDRFTQRGSVIAYIAKKDSEKIAYTVAVVGEVPIVTAQRVIAKLQPMAQN